MKKIMRGVLLFGMLGGMFISCSRESGNKSISLKESDKVFRIGVSQIVDHPALNDSNRGFKDALKNIGLNVEYDDKIANNEMATQNLIMKQFSTDKKDLVYAITTPTAQAAKNQVDTKIPVVFASVTDPMGAGLLNIENITGTSGAAPLNENLELMKEIFPNIKKIGIIYNSSEVNSVTEVNNLKKIANEKGFEIVEKSITNGTELISAINIIAKDIDIYYAIQDNTVASYFKVILEVLNENKVPVFGTNDLYSRGGGFISQGTTDYDIGYRAGEIAAEILLKKKNPKDIKIENVKNLQIEINRKNMNLLEINVPENILKRARFVE